MVYYYLLGSLLVTIVFFILIAFNDINIERWPSFIKQFLVMIMTILVPQYYVWNYFEPTMTKSGRVLLIVIITMLILPCIVLGIIIFTSIIILILLTALLCWLWQGYCWVFRRRNI